MTDAEPSTAYRVLARKYRPSRFADLIGQDAMVRTLSNAIAGGRLAHAFVLTGVRGVGKTTTARIIARVLNCVGPDGAGGPTVDPCGVCAHCVAIAEDRHMDVIEMDAASHTGVDDIRELIDGVRYRPVSARYKVYIVDEVHMLSKNAFNALLKTLEEPPEHVKFVFATTEIRKVPITVLSRCQRFDLRRIDQDLLARHLSAVADKEGRALSPAAALVLARAADGSVRDGLSLLDRAIAHVDPRVDGGAIGEDAMRALLGLADRTQVFELFEAVMRGDASTALARLGESYRAGADPLVIVQDLLELTHWLTRLKAAPALADDASVPEVERARGRALAQALSVPALARAWQILLKGLGELQTAPQPLAAAEMLLVRLAYAAELPSPADLVANLKDGAPPAPTRADMGPRPAASLAPAFRAVAPGNSAAQARLAPEPEPSPPAPTAEARPDPHSFEAVVDLFFAKREGILHGLLTNRVHLVKFEPGRIEINAPDTPRDFASRLMALLERWTGRRWIVTLTSSEAGAPTLAAQAAARLAEQKAAAAQHPLVAAVLETFPGATIEAVRGAKDKFGAADAEPAFENDTPESEDER